MGRRSNNNKMPPIHFLFSSPKQSKKKTSDGEIRSIIGLALALGLLWLIAHYGNAVIAFGFLILFALVAAKLISRRNAKSHAVETQRCIQTVVERHMATLVRRRAQTVYRDDYGREVTNKWERELLEFVHHHVMPALPDYARNALESISGEVVEVVDNIVRKECASRPTLANFSNSMTPTEFENFCAAQLRSLGWEARVTQASGDQGVDVIATKQGKKLVVQCKLYGRPIGNKAVQEISAARLHESADFAAVVGNQAYTPSARRLAATNGVALLHYSEMADEALMSKMSVSMPSSPPPFRRS